MNASLTPVRLCLFLGAALAASVGLTDPLPPDTTNRPLPTAPLDVVKKSDMAAKPAVQQRQSRLLADRYDLSDRPMPTGPP